MEHGSIITQARREDALVLTKQGRGSNFPKLCVAPGRVGGYTSPEPKSRPLTSWGSEPKAPTGLPSPSAPASLFALRPQWGRRGAPAPGARGGGASSAQLSPYPAPPPPV